MWKTRSVLVPISLVVSGCASLDAQRDLERSAASVEAAVGLSADFLRMDEQAARAKTDELLTGELTAGDAVQIALLNNPRVRAAMLSIGVSRADVVQATLFTNPTLTLSLRLPDGGGLANFETALTQNIADLWLVPARKRVAQHALDRTVLDAARTAASIALDARTAYVRAVHAAGQQVLARDQQAIADRLVEIALLRQQAGSGSEIDVNLARTQKLEADVAVRNAALAATEARSELARVLGISASPESLVLADDLAQPAHWAVRADGLHQVAREHRLDLRIADQSVAVAEAGVREERVRFLKSVEAGFALERGERRSRGNRNWVPRESEGTDVILGPVFGVELPLWDQNQAQIARAERLYQQTLLLRDALLVDAAQDIHSRLARAQTAAENARFYRDEQMPVTERSAQLSREAYRAGRLSFLAVLEAERNLLAARSGYLATLEAAALATIELERVTGRPAAALLELADSNAPSTARPTSAPVTGEGGR